MRSTVEGARALTLPRASPPTPSVSPAGCQLPASGEDQPSRKTRRTWLATCRDERRKAAGALSPLGAATWIETRTSRGAAAAVSTRPAAVGTNTSGPRSPTQ